jgi:hypothetical protein
MSYPERKEVEILGYKFTLKRLTAAQDDELSELKSKSKSSDARYLELAMGVEPAHDVAWYKQLPREVVTGLWIEWLQFNNTYYDFLARSLTLLPPALQTLVTREQNKMQSKPSENTTS